ncbi:MAG: hypothetical protein J4400_02260 [Candidatus Aenigmarchaeota archaeon]|nr:hypothetical protein [Candidatus Aenigmarchaeota archaeon]
MGLLEDLSGLETPEQYADWLLKNLEELHQLPEDQVPTKYKVNHESQLWLFTLYNHLESPLDALEKAYRSIPEERRQPFRQAIGIALHRCAEIEDPIILPVVEYLTYLIGAAGATEALDGLLETASNEYVAENHRSIFYDAISSVMTLAPDDRVFDFTHNLANNPYFNDGLLFDAMKIMIECRPDDYRQIVGENGQRIQRLYGTVKGKEPEPRYWRKVDLLFEDYPDVKGMIRDFSKM